VLVAHVDDAEPVAVGIFQHNEVRILWIAVPVDPPGPANGSDPDTATLLRQLS
jgi:hypothetical protein